MLELEEERRLLTAEAEAFWRLHGDLENQLDNIIHLLGQVDERIQANHRAFLRTFGVYDED